MKRFALALWLSVSFLIMVGCTMFTTPEDLEEINEAFCRDNPTHAGCQGEAIGDVALALIEASFYEVINRYGDDTLSDVCETVFSMTSPDLRDRCRSDQLSLVPDVLDEFTLDSMVKETHNDGKDYYHIKVLSLDEAFFVMFVVGFVMVEDTMVIHYWDFEVEEVMVIDTIPPTFDVIPDQEIIQYSSPRDWTLLIENVLDNVSTVFTKTVINDAVNYDVYGSYDVTVEVRDEAGNATTQRFTVTVLPAVVGVSDSDVLTAFNAFIDEYLSSDLNIVSFYDRYFSTWHWSTFNERRMYFTDYGYEIVSTSLERHMNSTFSGTLHYRKTASSDIKSYTFEMDVTVLKEGDIEFEVWRGQESKAYLMGTLYETVMHAFMSDYMNESVTNSALGNTYFEGVLPESIKTLREEDLRNNSVVSVINVTRDYGVPFGPHEIMLSVVNDVGEYEMILSLVAFVDDEGTYSFTLVGDIERAYTEAFKTEMMVEYLTLWLSDLTDVEMTDEVFCETYFPSEAYALCIQLRMMMDETIELSILDIERTDENKLYVDFSVSSNNVFLYRIKSDVFLNTEDVWYVDMFVILEYIINEDSEDPNVIDSLYAESLFLDMLEMIYDSETTGDIICEMVLENEEDCFIDVYDLNGLGYTLMEFSILDNGNYHAEVVFFDLEEDTSILVRFELSYAFMNDDFRLRLNQTFELRYVDLVTALNMINAYRDSYHDASVTTAWLDEYYFLNTLDEAFYLVRANDLENNRSWRLVSYEDHFPREFNAWKVGILEVVEDSIITYERIYFRASYVGDGIFIEFYVVDEDEVLDFEVTLETFIDVFNTHSIDSVTVCVDYIHYFDIEHCMTFRETMIERELYLTFYDVLVIGNRYEVGMGFKTIEDVLIKAYSTYGWMIDEEGSLRLVLTLFDVVIPDIEEETDFDEIAYFLSFIEHILNVDYGSEQLCENFVDMWFVEGCVDILSEMRSLYGSLEVLDYEYNDHLHGYHVMIQFESEDKVEVMLWLFTVYEIEDGYLMDFMIDVMEDDNLTSLMNAFELVLEVYVNDSVESHNVCLLYFQEDPYCIELRNVVLDKALESPLRTFSVTSYEVHENVYRIYTTVEFYYVDTTKIVYYMTLWEPYYDNGSYHWDIEVTGVGN